MKVKSTFEPILRDCKVKEEKLKSSNYKISSHILKL